MTYLASCSRSRSRRPFHPRGVRALAVALLVAAAAPAARADGFRIDPWAWGLAAGEVSTAGYAALRFTDHVPVDGAAGLAANLSPMAIGVGVGLLANHDDLDARPALAAHGAVWGALDGVLLAIAIEDSRGPSARGHGLAWTLGAVGAVAGGVLGATAGNRWRDGWLNAPAIGFMGGGIVGGVLLITAGDSNNGADRLIYGVAGGVATCMVAAAVIGFTRSPASPSSTPGPSLAPQIGPDRVLVSLGGSF